MIRAVHGGVSVDVHVVPGASVSAVIGRHGDALRIRIAAPPVDGRANDALVRFIASALGVGRAAVSVEHGASGRRKVVRIAGVTPDAVERLLEP